MSDIVTRTIAYQDGGKGLEGLLVHDGSGGEGGSGARPCVLVFPTVQGRKPLEEGFAAELVRLGYVAFIADHYGPEFLGAAREVCGGQMNLLLGDRPALRSRVLASLAAARALPEVQGDRICAVGYCFGGLYVLDLARAGADVLGVASFHGLLKPPAPLEPGPIAAKTIVFHGWDDPFAPPEDVAALGAELTAAGSDWQIVALGNTTHGFTNPDNNWPERGIMYQGDAARRSWTMLEDFLVECFG